MIARLQVEKRPWGLETPPRVSFSRTGKFGFNVSEGWAGKGYNPDIESILRHGDRRLHNLANIRVEYENLVRSMLSEINVGVVKTSNSIIRFPSQLVRSSDKGGVDSENTRNK